MKQPSKKSMKRGKSIRCADEILCNFNSLGTFLHRIVGRETIKKVDVLKNMCRLDCSNKYAECFGLLFECI